MDASPAPKTNGDRIEAHAAAIACPRHAPLLRACAYEDGKPCACRAAALAGEGDGGR